ncbi:hypothetical protein [Aureimonas sp. AU40]|uniref:hypothetical protein n=1 Tax=Aureimonas sp. AU40 TaxID=1637747 RepID=UPI0007830490|nr:hypothetical protein [Aureimonas sp. AU40]
MAIKRDRIIDVLQMRRRALEASAIAMCAAFFIICAGAGLDRSRHADLADQEKNAGGFYRSAHLEAGR